MPHNIYNRTAEPLSIVEWFRLDESDFSGIIAAPEFQWAPESTLSAAGLAGWDFTNVSTSDRMMRPYFRTFGDSPFVDISQGFEAFSKHRSQSGLDLVKSMAQRVRKMEREIATMRFESHVVDRNALALLYEWKAAQCARTGTVDVLGTPWMRQIIHRLVETTTEDFCGTLDR